MEINCALETRVCLYISRGSVTLGQVLTLWAETPQVEPP